MMQKFPLIIIFGAIVIIFFIHFADVQDLQSSCPTEKCNRTSGIYYYSNNGRRLLASRTSSFPKSCKCDDKCATYKDCCADSPYARTSNTTGVGSDVVCAKIGDEGYFVKRACNLSKYKKRCAFSSNYTRQAKNVRNKVPATSLSSGLTYGNMFCAQCDNVTDFQLWNVSVVCETVNETVAIAKNSTAGQRSFFGGGRPDLKDRLTFDDAGKLWRMRVGNRTENCTLNAVVPDALKSGVRPCSPGLVRTCPSNWTQQNVTDRCADEYQSIVVGGGQGGREYRNVYCALCNGEPLENVTCKRYPRYSTLVRYPFRTAVTPMNRTRSSAGGGKARTSTTTAAPPPAKKPNKKRSYMYAEMDMDCVTALGFVNFTRIDAETVHYTTLNRTYVRDTLFIDGLSVRTCDLGANRSSPFEDGGGGGSFDDPIDKFVHRACFVLAALFASLHLRAFFLPRNAGRSLNQKNVASYAFAFALGNVGLLLLWLSDNVRWCPVGDLLFYFGFVGSALWCCCATFDVSRTIWRRASGDHRQRSDERKIFVVYSIISWTATTVLTVLNEFVSSGIIEADFGDGGGTRPFYAATRFAIFVLPLIVTVSVNLSFYASSKYAVSTAEPAAVADLSTKGDVEFKLHAGLVLLNDLMCFVLLLIVYLDSRLLTVTFVAVDLAVGVWLYVNSPVQNAVSRRINQLLNDYTSNARTTKEK